MIYKNSKLVKFPSWVGIVPVNWFVLKSLFFFVWEVKYFEMTIKIIIIWYDYKFVRLEKFPNSVRIVPESWLSLAYLFFFSKGEWFFKRKRNRKKEKKFKK